MTIRTDASKKDWGTVHKGISIGGEWNLQEQQLHINEGSRTSFASISQAFSNESYSFPNRQYNNLVLCCEDGENQKQVFNGITITAEYLPSSMDVEADWQSINSKDHSEWKLLPQVFQRICQIKGKPEMDLFASRLSAQLPRYNA